MGILAGIVGSIANIAGSVIKALSVTLKEGGNILMSLGKALGLIKPETKLDELGDKAIQSDYNPEDYDSYSEYVKAVEEFELDPEKSGEISLDEKERKGAELATGVTVEKYKDFPMDKLCVSFANNPEYFTELKIQEIANLIKEDEQYIPEIVNFIDGSEKDEIKIEEVVDTLAEVEKKVDPNISTIDAMKNALNLRK